MQVSKLMRFPPSLSTIATVGKTPERVSGVQAKQSSSLLYTELRKFNNVLMSMFTLGSRSLSNPGFVWDIVGHRSLGHCVGIRYISQPNEWRLVWLSALMSRWTHHYSPFWSLERSPCAVIEFLPSFGMLSVRGLQNNLRSYRGISQDHYWISAWFYLRHSAGYSKWTCLWRINVKVKVGGITPIEARTIWCNLVHLFSCTLNPNLNGEVTTVISSMVNHSWGNQV